jgi:hypothetical protein
LLDVMRDEGFKRYSLVEVLAMTCVCGVGESDARSNAEITSAVANAGAGCTKWARCGAEGDWC